MFGSWSVKEDRFCDHEGHPQVESWPSMRILLEKTVNVRKQRDSSGLIKAINIDEQRCACARVEHRRLKCLARERPQLALALRQIIQTSLNMRPNNRRKADRTRRENHVRPSRVVICDISATLTLARGRHTKHPQTLDCDPQRLRQRGSKL